MLPRAALPFVLALGACTSLVPSVARADEEEEEPPAPFRYRMPQPPARGRALLEELAVLGVGFAEYVGDKEANTRDFDLEYDWPSLRSKLLFQSLAFDNNRFGTNWVTHPIGGYFYYGVARGNRLSIGESFLYSALASTIWEVFGEWREQASINDLVVTPMAGMVVGESFFQLGALFQRSRPSFGTTSLSWLFGSLKNVNDLFDDAEMAPPIHHDALGLPDDEWHQFRVSLGGGATWQDRGAAYVDGRFEVGARVVALPDYEREGSHHRWFYSGEVTSLSLGLTMTKTGVADFLFSSEVMPFGYYDHELRDAEGQTTVTGLRLAFDYGTHDYDRDGRREVDRISTLGVGLGLEHTIHADAFALEARFDALADFAGVDAYALPEYERLHAKSNLSSVLANESYYYALGMTVRPTVRLSFGRFDAGATVRFDSFTSIEALDRTTPYAGTVSANDWRTDGRAWVGVTPADQVRVELSAARRLREGRVADVSSERGETALFATFDVRF